MTAPPVLTGTTDTGSGGGLWDTIKGLAGPIGSLAGGVLDAFSQNSANKTNAANVDKQIAFQKDQGATQYQRAVADMKAAGLNPALAYSQGGNSAQSGAAAQVQPTMRDTGDKISNALQIANIKKQGDLIDAQASAASAQALSTGADWMIKQPEAKWAQMAANQDIFGNVRNLEYGTRQREAGRDTTRFDTAIASTKAGTEAATAQAAASRASAGLSGSAQRLNEQDYLPDAKWITTANQYNNLIRRGLGTTGQVLDQVTAIKGLRPPPKAEPKLQNYDHETTTDPESNMKFERRRYRP